LNSLREHWRISTFRLALIFGVVFTVANVVLLGLVYWQTSSYLERRIDDSIVTMAGNFKSQDRSQVQAEVRDALAFDLRKSNIYCLFDVDGHVIAGNMEALPPELRVDGKIHQFNHRTLPQYSPGGVASEGPTGLARAMVRRLANGEILVVGRDFTQLAEIKAIILNALIVSGTAIIALGLLSGFLLSIRPLRRINAIRDAARRIVQGELSLRLPLSSSDDEVDMLSAIVNRMLDEIERLLTEVKSVTDTLAHDLRTPLTRVRLTLYRMQQTMTDSAQRQLIDKAVAETDSLLGRFRALLRISEIENRQRRAGFESINPADVLAPVTELFDALAEDKSIVLDVQVQPVPPILADPDLLFEAISNLVDNAIKFTPAGGRVTVTLGIHEGGARFDIVDTGCGIGADKHDAVLRRFYREGPQDGHEGYGLGLSIVAAIIQLHGFSLKFQPVEQGTHISILCSTPATD
jgi:signal transduction histidine kinase